MLVNLAKVMMDFRQLGGIGVRSNELQTIWSKDGVDVVVLFDPFVDEYLLSISIAGDNNKCFIDVMGDSIDVNAYNIRKAYNVAKNVAEFELRMNDHILIENMMFPNYTVEIFKYTSDHNKPIVKKIPIVYKNCVVRQMALPRTGLLKSCIDCEIVEWNS